MQAVADDAQNIFLDDDGFFPQRQGQGVDSLRHFVPGLLALGDLHQRHQVRGIPEVHPAEALRVLHCLGDVAHPQTGGVGGEQGLRRDMLADGAVKRLLDLQVLCDVFHDEIGAVIDGEVRGVGDALGNGSGGLVQQALFLQNGQVPGNALLGTVQGRGAAVPEGDGVSGLGKDAGQGHAHGPGPGHHRAADGGCRHSR